MGVRQDYAEAAKWYRLAAELGLSSAQVNLGSIYAGGRGVSQNYLEAMKWFRLAAEQGNANAQNNLGHMYAEGQGVPQDFVQAHMGITWPLLAPTNDKFYAKIRDQVAVKMTPNQIAESQRLAREWLAAHKGFDNQGEVAS